MPTVRGLHPLWDARREGPTPVIEGLRSDRREVLVTHLLDAGPDYTWGMTVAAVMALVFLGLKVYEYSNVPYAWDDHSYGSIIWLIVGFHSAHVFSVVLKTVVVAVLSVRGYFNAERNLGVQINGLYWHFVVAVWLPLYAVIYWSPRLLE
jgi:heme/copper-type cytochrome/quinol oxidase subunit 3